MEGSIEHNGCLRFSNGRSFVDEGREQRMDIGAKNPAKSIRVLEKGACIMNLHIR